MLVFSPQAYGFDEFQKTLGAVLMGRTTFEPALQAPRWPWTASGSCSSSRCDGIRLTPVLGTDTALTLESERALSGGLVELSYEVRR